MRRSSPLNRKRLRKRENPGTDSSQPLLILSVNTAKHDRSGGDSTGIIALRKREYSAPAGACSFRSRGERNQRRARGTFRKVPLDPSSRPRRGQRAPPLDLPRGCGGLRRTGAAYTEYSSVRTIVPLYRSSCAKHNSRPEASIHVPKEHFARP